MPTRNLTIRLEDGLRDAAEVRAALEDCSVADVARAALRAYLAGDAQGEAIRRTLEQARRAETEQERVRLLRVAAGQQAARAKAAAAVRQARADERQSREEAFIAGLAEATWDDPVTAPRLADLSGFTRGWCRDLFAALTRTGYLEKIDTGKWVPVPGKDIREGMPQAKILAQTGAARIAPGKRGTPDGSTPATVPAAPAATATQAAEAASAAKGNGRIAGARKRAEAPGSPLVAAKDVPRPGTVPFQAGPDVDCIHENMRIRKGVCPDCKQWVTK